MPSRAHVAPVVELRPGAVPLADVMAGLSCALDLTEGERPGHAVRSALVAMRLARAVGLDAVQRAALFHAALLKDAGCSTNASKVAALFGHDDRLVKHDRKRTDHQDARASLRHLARNTRPGASPLRRGRQLLGLVRHGSSGARELIRLRCERGADVARSVGLDEASAEAIRALDEHWDGSGYPAGVAGADIPVLGRVLCLAQTVEVFFGVGGIDAALGVARERRGAWFDPALVDALAALGPSDVLWRTLEHGDARAALAAEEPRERLLLADDDGLDRVARAFAGIVDAKSPYTARHSEGVARIAAGVAGALGFTAPELRDLERAALLHDVGKLGVSNTILDKPGKLDEREWAAMRRHPSLTADILRRVPAFAPITLVAAAHHERLDGSGYHRGLPAERLPLAARVLAVADVFEALTAERPYRAGLPTDEALAIMRRDAGAKLDAQAFAALEGVAGTAQRPARATAA